MQQGGTHLSPALSLGFLRFGVGFEGVGGFVGVVVVTLSSKASRRQRAVEWVQQRQRLGSRCLVLLCTTRCRHGVAVDVGGGRGSVNMASSCGIVVLGRRRGVDMGWLWTWGGGHGSADVGWWMWQRQHRVVVWDCWMATSTWRQHGVAVDVGWWTWQQ